MKRLVPHPFAELLPMMSDAEYEALRRDIDATKQRDAIVLLDGKILDGRNRYRACVELKLEPKTMDFPASWGDPLDYVKSKAQHRHMSESQRACVAVTFHERLVARQNSDDAPTITNDDLSALFAVNRDYVFKAKMLREHASGLFDDVFHDRTPIYVAAREHKRSLKAKALKAKARIATRDSAGEPQWQIIAGDCIAEMGALRRADKRPRLIFGDSPYNIGIDYENGAKADRRPESEFITWCEEWIAGATQLLADDGSIFLMIDAAHLADFELILRGSTGGITMHRRNVIVWPETFSQHTAGNFTESWRAILYYTKHPSKFVWHGDGVLIPSDRQLKYGDKRADPAGKVPTNVWSDIPRMVDNDAERIPGFPTQLPERLLERIVLACSEPGDLVLDPFNGSGTTGRAAIRHGRRYIGIDKSSTFVGLATASLRVLQSQLASQPVEGK